MVDWINSLNSIWRVGFVLGALLWLGIAYFLVCLLLQLMNADKKAQNQIIGSLLLTVALLPVVIFGLLIAACGIIGYQTGSLSPLGLSARLQAGIVAFAAIWFWIHGQKTLVEK